jgi:hypothetical protein
MGADKKDRPLGRDSRMLSSMSVPDLDSILRSAGVNASAFDRIRLARGVVGKASYVAACTVVGLGVVAIVMRDPLYLIIDAALIFIAFVVYFFGVIWFANKHPGLSLLEGAELIQWRQMEMAAKAGPIKQDLPNTSPAPQIINATD